MTSCNRSVLRGTLLLAMIGFASTSTLLFAASNVHSVMPVDTTLRSTLSETPNETRGKRIFDMNCARCHQADAHGSAERKIPALAGQQYEYLVKQLVDFITLERRNNTMHQQLERSGMNNATAIADVVGYVANLPSNPSPGVGSGTAVSQGKQIYDGLCASCHGRTAQGNGDLWVPNLRGQHYSYLLEQMQRMAYAQRHNVSEDLHHVFTLYSQQEFESVADYLSRWTQQN